MNTTLIDFNEINFDNLIKLESNYLDRTIYYYDKINIYVIGFDNYSKCWYYPGPHISSNLIDFNHMTI
jgi:hypothetical protein